ncbi:Nucleoside 2-deoxyribosyltransferase [Paracidovorax anthurii]|uniref:Nucleoside 2-deoxyribosyltransferase n=1 Tax=Paracidovorax anthurii TaxID=78229 RepID=A0A328YCE2_9BURK|nr:nucleoside 2-deoxyribosyltransferase [Paracidovorax anthurii]
MQQTRRHEAPLTSEVLPEPRPRIYLAGPDVFDPRGAQVFAQLKAWCAQEGLEGVAPTDAQVEGDGGGDALAQRIYEGNIRLIREADGVAANLAAFRGLEPDSGTVFEVGYAIALGKPVVGYGVPPESYEARVCAAMPCVRDDQGVAREQGSGWMVEGLGQRLNLMLARSVALEPTAREALARLARSLGVRGA